MWASRSAEVLASIPSPSSAEIVIGPLSLRAYGLMIAIGVIAAVELGRRRWRARGHDPDDISSMALWAVPAGLIGSRLYHVITDWQRFEGQWVDAVKVWEGGLGIPGGIIGGALAGVIYARVKKLPLGELADTVAPAIPLAQAIGRLGNWFNQELFGGPSTLPWALEIDIVHRPDRYLSAETFHPTFLYEALWNLALVALLILIDRRRALRPGSLFFVYLGGYFTGRLWIEAMRIDEASLIWGIRVNIWTSLFAMAVSLAVVVIRGRRRPEDDLVDDPDDVDEPPAVDDDPAASREADEADAEPAPDATAGSTADSTAGDTESDVGSSGSSVP